MNFGLFLTVLVIQSTLGAVFKPARTVIIIHPANDVERAQRSIFYALKERNGQLASRIAIYLYDILYKGHKGRMTVVLGQRETYSFKTGVGMYRVEEFRKPSARLYTSGKEVHNFEGDSDSCLQGRVDEHKFCDSRSWSKSESEHHLSRWLPREIYDQYLDKLNFLGKQVGSCQRTFQFEAGVISSCFLFLLIDLSFFAGLNVLLEIFYKVFESDPERVACESTTFENAELYGWTVKTDPRKCSISFGENVRLDYGLISNENFTDYPMNIELFERNQTTGDWKRTKEFRYSTFEPMFGGVQIVNSSLPISHGCRRMSPGNYPKIDTDYGTKFELELEIYFDYQVENDDFYDGSGVEPERAARVYSVKMLVDAESAINVADTIDEKTNASIRTFYETKSHLLYSLNLAYDVCSVYNLTTTRSLNWFYVQEIFARRPELFFANENYSYLRDFDLNGVPTRVFEETVDYRVWASEEYRRWKDGIRESDSERSSDHRSGTSRQRVNRVPTENNLVRSTHYYPIDSSYWPDNPNQLSIPKRIELTIFGRFHSVGYSRMVIDIKSFKSNPEEWGKYFRKNCDLKDTVGN